ENVGFKEVPSFSGFWNKEIYTAQTLQQHREVLEGVAYNVAPLKRVALFPTSAGRQRVEPMVVTCQVPLRQGRRGSLLDEFAFGRPTETLLVRSRALELRIMPLPEAGRPAGFSGAVGRYSLTAQASPSTVAQGDPVTLRVELSGTGNLSAVGPLELSLPRGIKAYDPKVQEEEQVVDGRYGGGRTYEYILIPELGGRLQVPPVRLAYFDPEHGEYRTAQSEAVAITSQPSGPAPDAAAYALSRSDIQAVGQDIRYIKPDTRDLGAGVQLWQQPLFWIAQGLLPAALLALVLRRRHRERLQGDVAYARRHLARGHAQRRLKRAAELLDQGRGPELHAEVHRALISFVADRTNHPPASLTPEASARLLTERGVDPHLVGEMQQVLERCELVRFAATEPSQAEVAEIHERAGNLLASLERTL
ncbi:MAG: BatD family protein, partial [Candidatus Latescibacterota bacterium]